MIDWLIVHVSIRTKRPRYSRRTWLLDRPCSSHRCCPAVVAVAGRRRVAVVAGSNPGEVAVVAGSTVGEAVVAGSSPVVVVAGTCYPFLLGSSFGSGCLGPEEGPEVLCRTWWMETRTKKNRLAGRRSGPGRKERSRRENTKNKINK